jgi:glucose 1-dehydrogenase
MVSLQGQTAIVTGASSGIGRAIALAFGRAGANVVVNYVSAPPAALSVVEEIRTSKANAIAHQADVSDESQVMALFDRARGEFGTIDILVANAGMQADAAIDAMSLSQWNKVLSVNLTGQFLCAREAIREFRRRGMRPDVSRALGKIICMSSVHQEIPWAGHVNYAASKGGIELMMRSLAQEVSPDGKAFGVLHGGTAAHPGGVGLAREGHRLPSREALRAVHAAATAHRDRRVQRTAAAVDCQVRSGPICKAAILD